MKKYYKFVLYLLLLVWGSLLTACSGDNNEEPDPFEGILGTPIFNWQTYLNGELMNDNNFSDVVPKTGGNLKLHITDNNFIKFDKVRIEQENQNYELKYSLNVDNANGDVTIRFPMHPELGDGRRIFFKIYVDFSYYAVINQKNYVRQWTAVFSRRIE